MARDYGMVLKALGIPFRVIGRGVERAAGLQAELGQEVESGGLSAALAAGPPPEVAIVAVGIAELADCTRALLEVSVPKMLIEKPGFGRPSELRELAELAESRGTIALLAYNRRFYSSVRRARELIREEGEASAFHLDFTEWSHQISQLPKTRVEWEIGFLAIPRTFWIWPSSWAARR